jgi:(4S)-4-hydroxy-5-phosphonooxypentane-2,3-dione isomerase
LIFFVCGGVDMSKLAIVGKLELEPGHLDRVLPLLTAHRTRCLADEPGTLQSEVLLPHDDQTQVLLYEVYTDEAAFQVHWNGPSTARLREEAAGMIVGVTGTRCVLCD